MDTKKKLYLEFLRLLDSLENKNGSDGKATLSCGSEVTIKIKKKRRLSLVKVS